MIAIEEARRAGLFKPEHWMRNVVAGLIVGVVALPLAIAFAIASGVKPEQGIYTAIVAGLAVSLFGGSRVQIAGPTGAFIVILSGIVAEHGVQGLQLATLMAGVMLVVFGLARFGAVIKFIPLPVVAGFTAGIGVIIWVGQWQHFFGLPDIAERHFHQKLPALLSALPGLDLPTTLVGAVSLAILLGVPRIPGFKRVPAALVALVVLTTVQSFAGFATVATIGSTFGALPQSLPVPQLPAITVSRVIELIGPAFAIAMLGAIESLLSAVVADRMSGTRHQSNQELVGQGVANILAPLFGGIAATGAIARTATSIRSGGTSPLAGIVHALTLVALVLLLAPLAANIPLATLAAILFVVAWNMSEPRHVMHLLRRAPRADVIILLCTFLLTVFADLVVAVNIGVVLAMLLFLRRMATAVVVRERSRPEGHGPAGQVVLELDGPLFFAAADTVQVQVRALAAHATRLELHLERVPFADATGLQALHEVIHEQRARGCEVHWHGANARVASALRRMGSGPA